jgi:hypothetical protein
VSSQCFTPKASLQSHLKQLEDSPVSSISKRSSDRRNPLRLSVSQSLTKIKRKCKKSINFLELSNKNVRISSQNSAFRTNIKEKDEKIAGLEDKIKKCDEECRVKDEMIKKLSDFILKREKQFAAVITSETDKLYEVIREKDFQLEKIHQKVQGKFVQKAIQVNLDTVFDEMLQEKNDEIVRLQDLLESNNFKYSQELSFLQEQVSLLEQELEKAQTFCSSLPQHSNLFSLLNS